MPDQRKKERDAFVRLTPQRVLAAVEAAGLRATGVCYPLNSFENRVYEVELDDRARVVAKFYRPGRWSEAQILEEHGFLAALAHDEIPVCPVRRFPNGDTVAQTDGLFYALWDRQGGRAPDELNLATASRLGRAIGRMHSVAAGMGPSTRPRLDTDRYIRGPLRWLQERDHLPREFRLPRHLEPRFVGAAEELAEVFDARLGTTAQHRVHGDLHLGNLLLRNDRLYLLDFDDMAVGPAVQDLWLAAPGRDADSLRLRASLIAGYETFRLFDPAQLALIEPLRGLRMVRYTGWLARRWDDPAFRAGWPHFGTPAYWQEQTVDLEDQVRVVHQEAPTVQSGTTPADGAVEEVLSNKDYFFDWEDDD